MTEITKIETKDGNIYEVDGKRYRELTKEPKNGDKILVINGAPNGAKTYKDGDILTVLSHDSDGDVYIQEPDADGDILWSSEFVIVELIEQETAQLSRKITRLEERTEETHRNIITFSQMAESARSDASKAVGGVNALEEQLDLVREDIVSLDEKIDEVKEIVEGRNVTPVTINIENLNISGTESLKEFIERIAKGCGRGVM
ncbi:hypothetical protein [Bacillus thuringiensis]|uniref:hypothetical protein n=1 Tax=Bacillus thuringiensis TaxID=1428 RepID=UPI000A37712B|nr:hypothetical protein [Bacillus thuringiensis]OUA56826.1 hypothetical protein BK781_18680 [Bacillus thuringiensis serovar aizawai]